MLAEETRRQVSHLDNRHRFWVPGSSLREAPE